MNLRDIKKDIEYVLGAFIDDCAIFATINPKASDEKLSELLDEAVDLYNELKDKANARKIEGKKAAYFTALRKEILEKTDALYEKLSAVVKGTADEAPAKKVAPKAAPKAAAKPAAPKAEAPAEKPAAAKKAPAKKAEPKAEAPVAEKPAAKKAPAKKAAAPKAEAKPAAEKKPAAAKAPAKKAPAAKKPAAKKPAAKKAE